MAKSRLNSLIQENQTSLQLITLSPFSINKKPTTLYEHVINALSVDLEAKRSGDSKKCPLETRYQALKKDQFPKHEILDLFLRSAHKSEHARKAQKKMKDFFKQKVVATTAEVKVEITVKEEPTDVEFIDSDNDPSLE